eukprot:882987_1
MANLTLNQILTVVYVTIQVGIASFVSVIGALHVRRSMQKAGSTPPNTAKPADDHDELDQKGTGTDPSANGQTNITMSHGDATTQKGFCELWIKIVWKMRSVYSCLAVHSFDVLTDVLVIVQWMNTRNITGDNVDPQIMAYSAIAVIVMSRVLSAVAIFIKERDFTRSLLQLFDFLIFQEIYESHHKIVSQFKNKQLRDKNHPIDSTLSFKYVRNMEAIFESIPEAVLQLVYVMRIGTTNFGREDIIFIISIVQSIISMTNSILNNDYTMMKEDKWARHKQRFPPTIEFFKHAICRLSEIIYRIGLLALFWSVCEGEAFAVLIGVEFFIIFLRVGLLLILDAIIFDADTILLAISSIIVIASEEIYGIVAVEGGIFFCSSINEGGDSCLSVTGGFILISLLTILCCMGPAAVLALGVRLCINKGDDNAKVGFPPIIRIGTSLYEIIFIFIWAFVGADRWKFLFKAEHGLVILIVTCICFLIFSQYRILFPNFALPLDVNVRSKWGYAYSNELTELQKIKVPLKSKRDFWDEPYTFYEDNRPLTAAMFALAKGNHEIVQWLEDQGAILHKNADSDMFTRFIFISTRGKYE